MWSLGAFGAQGFQGLTSDPARDPQQQTSLTGNREGSSGTSLLKSKDEEDILRFLTPANLWQGLVTNDPHPTKYEFEPGEGSD